MRYIAVGKSVKRLHSYVMIRAASGSPLRHSLRGRLFREVVLSCQCGHHVRYD
jgi:hypothetical protein